MTESKENNDQKRSRRVVQGNAHWIEWLTGAISGLIVLAIIGWIAWQAPGEREGAPELRVNINQITKSADGYRISFTVFNDGRRTAASVPVTARLLDGSNQVEEREVTFDYVPALSNTSGAVLFSTDPRQYKLEIRASGYEDP